MRLSGIPAKKTSHAQNMKYIVRLRMLMLNFLKIVILLFAFRLTPFHLLAQSSYEAIEEAMESIQRNQSTQLYWFEKESTIFEGLWIKTILIFGYPDNLTPCEFIRDAAKKDIPSQNFRCTPVEPK